MFRVPKGISELRESGGKMSMKVSIPGDTEGFFGRTCLSCKSFFKLRVDEFKAAPENELVCAYCGHRASVSDFITADQRERVVSAAKAYAVAKIQDAFGRAFRPATSSGGMFSISIEYKPGTPPRLHSYVEDQVRRTVICDACSRAAAVYGATSFCPYCGPRNVRVRVRDEIEAQRRALALFDHLPDDVREEAKAVGVMDTAAADALENVVTLFEQFCRETFESIVANADVILKKERPNVFQSLEDTDRMFQEHAGLKIRAAISADDWVRLSTAFAKRHVLTHRGGVVDQRFLNRVPRSTLAVGQRLVVSRSEAEISLTALEAILTAAFGMR
jgi:hypothetical protein